MKIQALIMATTLIALAAFADIDEDFESAAPVTQSSYYLFDKPATEKINPLWNINIGLSQFDRGDFDGASLKGSGLTIEAQRKISRLYLGASYTSYNVSNTEYVNDIYGDSGYRSTRTNVDALAISGEIHPIELAFSVHSEFFAALTGGVMWGQGRYGRSASSEIEKANLFYGAGVGFNFENQMGLRADIKSNRDLKSFSSLSLVGYY